MKNIVEFKNQKILVLGLAKSGYYAAKLLVRLGAQVTVNDGADLSADSQAKELENLGVTIVSGSHPLELLENDFYCMVKNPGIPYSNPLVKRAMDKQLPIITEVELAYLINESGLIGITGTNGKTTTTKMTETILNSGLKKGKAYAVGNIGTPSTQIASISQPEDWLVMELSSFQLSGVKQFHPHIATITNIFDAHLDYHGNHENYLQAKWNIQNNMTTSDYLILNWSNPELRNLSCQTEATIIPFSAEHPVKNGAFFDGEAFYFKDDYVMPKEDLKVPGQHNIENALVAIAIAKLIGISNDCIRQGFHQFYGVPHRIQYVDDINQRIFYNDSKATNIKATITALKSFQSSLILLAGGLDRGNEFLELMPYLTHVKEMILFGETKDKLAHLADQAGITWHQVEDIQEAVKLSYQNSQEDDVILLSPACASWDQYPNFEARGEAFVEAIKLLKNKEL